MAVFPRIDYSRYKWHLSRDDSSVWVRQGGGGEALMDFMNRANQRESTLFLGLKLSLSSPLPPARLVEQARAAWASLRFEIPAVATNTRQDAEGNTVMVYRVPKDAEEVRAWARRTVALVERQPTMDELRTELSGKFIPDENWDQTFIHVIHRSDDRYEFLVHTSHVPFDATGIKVTMTRFLEKLALLLSGSTVVSPEDFQLGDEAKNLLPIITDILGPDEVASGGPFDQTLGSVLTDTATAVPHQCGLNPRALGPGPTRRISHTFSEEETAKILRGARERGFSVNQVAHAALSYMIAMDSPPPESAVADGVLVFQGIVNCRRRLAPPYNSPDGYPGTAVSVSPLVVPVSAALAKPGESDAAVVLRLSELMKAEYVKQKAYPSLAAISVQVFELMLMAVKATTAAPTTGSAWYSGDGVGETYLCPTYKDEARQTVIDVDDIFVSVNRNDPGPIFRLYTWRDKITIGADSNDYAMPAKDVEGFVQKWAELLRLMA